MSEDAELENIRLLLRDLFTSDSVIDEFLRTPHPELRGVSPLDALKAPGGYAKVRDLCLRVIHGIPT